ncbi:DNA polymerase kappa subunit [Monoraphidium neglectum]|uniref:DNA polymerase kappa n=1 Tax=Monoraphidium neglectum TaxID=145388 RepID=A0A0D2K9Q5_9CHLO|nr:DNA polymerase kappa subunit [Monoraphidium neglectum]KIY92783.1 DNA polymerase kappa subunit [Monoraphidium neglectum]|eukprot:XP_013891803.1 DNA polymerase kappa subunit [Monoraphidium neglectum]
MQGVDKDRVKKVVYEMSKDSAHFKNEQRKQAAVDEKIARLRQRAAALGPAELAAHTRAVDARVAALEARRDLGRTWLHCDMDAFYAAVEERDDPGLREVPMAVGGTGMITTANYMARPYGVRSAMPGFVALKLCPQLVFVKPNFEKYTAASEETRRVFRVYDPDFRAGSLDEAYLDVTDYCSRHGVTGEQVAAELRARVRDETRGLTCSVGVAPNQLLAKVASDINKPDGQYVLAPSRAAVTAFISSLPIRRVPGIGKVTEQLVSALGATTCGELFERRGLVAALFSPVALEFFLGVSLGLGATRHSELPPESEPQRKGISCERTFKAVSDPKTLHETVGAVWGWEEGVGGGPG